MILGAFIPSLQLQEFIRVFRIVHFSFSANDDIPVKSYPPRPENTLSFYPCDGESVSYTGGNRVIKNLKTVLVGQHDTITMREVGRNFLVVQVVFQPGALYRLTGIPARELLNSYLDAALVLGQDITLVNEQLFFATDYENMIQIIESFLLTIINKKKSDRLPIDRVMNQMLTSSKSIRTLADESCLSLKQFERRFMERTGLPPKYYNRIIRFERAYRSRNSDNRKSWRDIAFECDYNDYQHLTKDYKHFTGASPVQFHELDTQAPERSFGTPDTY